MYGIGVNYKLVAKILASQCEKILDLMDEEIIDLTLLIGDEVEFYTKLKEFIEIRAMKYKAVAKEMPFVSF